MTAPIYMTALVIVLAVCFSSDLLGERPKHIMGIAGFSVVCLAIVAGVDNSPKMRYAFMALGTSVGSLVAALL